jgi:hypothetical protein
MRAYVEIPLVPKFASAQHSLLSSKKAKTKAPLALHGNNLKSGTDEDDDLGGFGPEEDYLHQPRKTSLSMTEAGRSSAKRTGDRDDRGNTCRTSDVSY